MRTFLIKKFVKDYENVREAHVREGYGKLAGLVGIVSNLILCTLKILTGIVFNSIAILADGINNLADASSSLITLVGFRLASKPADEKHPYGYARIEYITGMIVSFLILFIGYQLLMTSIEKIRNPEPLEFSVLTIIVLLIAIGIKIWQALFNINIGKTINSTALKATGADSRNDVISTTVVLISVILGKITGLQLDGWMGLLVAAFILWSGIQLIKETGAPLLGETPDPELIDEIQEKALAYPGVLGIHDFMVHDYGPGRIYVTMHIEVDGSEDVFRSHDMIDTIEHDLRKACNIHLTCHMDPVNKTDPLVMKMHDVITEILRDFPEVLSFHDLRVVPGYTHSNVIFDVVVPQRFSMSDEALKAALAQRVRDADPLCFTVIDVDRSYVN